MGIKEILTNKEVVIEILEEIAAQTYHSRMSDEERKELDDLEEKVDDLKDELKGNNYVPDLYAACEEFIDAVDDVEMFKRKQLKINDLAKSLIKELKVS